MLLEIDCFEIRETLKKKNIFEERCFAEQLDFNISKIYILLFQHSISRIF